jgi:hypothetical protein
LFGYFGAIQPIGNNKSNKKKAAYRSLVSGKTIIAITKFTVLKQKTDFLFVKEIDR